MQRRQVLARLMLVVAVIGCVTIKECVITLSVERRSRASVGKVDKERRTENTVEAGCWRSAETGGRRCGAGGGDNYGGERAIRGGCSNIHEPFLFFGRKALMQSSRGLCLCVVVPGGGWWKWMDGTGEPEGLSVTHCCEV